MNAKVLCLTALLAGGMSPVFASSTVAFDPITEIAYFHGEDPMFVGGVDTVTFTGLAAGTYDYTLSFSSQFIDNVSASLNGTPVSLNSAGVFTFGSSQDSGTVPFVLTIWGTPELGAAYSGQMEITGNGGPSGSIPEPSSWALMLAGLGMAGMKLRQRSKS